MAVDNLLQKEFTEAVKTLKLNGVIRYDADIAKALGHSKGNISGYMSGKMIPSRRFLQKFYKFYKIEPPENPTLAMVSEARAQYKTRQTINGISADQNSMLAMNTNSYVFVLLELQCEAISRDTGEPLDKVRERVRRLIHDRRQRTEQVLKQLEEF